MKHIDPTELASLVARAFDASSLANDFEGADISVGKLEEDMDFIRVLVHLRNVDRLSADEADAITSNIEQTIAQYDDRFPSVRFAEP